MTKPFGHLISGLAGGVLAAGIVLANPILAGSMDAPTKPTRLSVSELRIVDAAGRTRAFLGLDNEGAPHLFLYQTDGDPQAHVGVSPAGPGIYLSRSNLEANISLLVDEKGPRIGVDDASGIVAVNLGNNKPGLTILRRTPKATWRIPGDQPQ